MMIYLDIGLLLSSLLLCTSPGTKSVIALANGLPYGRRYTYLLSIIAMFIVAMIWPYIAYAAIRAFVETLWGKK